MKSMRYIAMMVAALLMAACNDTQEIDNTPPASAGRISLETASESPLYTLDEESGEASVRFKSRGGDLVIDVVTNAEEWSYTTDAEWLELSADDYFLYVAASENRGDAARSATITLRAGEAEREALCTLRVTQNYSGQPEISVTTDSYNFKAHTELERVIEVESNTDDWLFDTTCSWLFLERVEGGLRLVADDNAAKKARSVNITLLASDEEDADRSTLVVSQDGSAFVVLNSHNVVTDDAGGERRLTLSSNPELSKGLDNFSDSWFTASFDEENIVIHVDSNYGANQRYGSFDVVIGEEDNRATATVHVRQIGPDTEELIYEVEIPEPDYRLTAAPMLSPSGGGQIVVDWGDGSEKEEFIEERGTHTYAEPGLYTITITGQAKSLRFGVDDDFSTELRNVLSWGKLGYTQATDMCLGCSRLESIPNDVAGSFANVKTFLGAFSCCESLREIPAGLFRYATQAKRFEECFSHSGAISEIPEGLFDNCIAAEDFSYAFYATGTGYVTTSDTLPNFSEVSEQVEQGLLTSIPANLFKNCPNIKQLDYIFGATAIESIPEELFASATLAEEFKGAFSACVRLKSIPEGLMLNTTSALNLRYMFAGCSSITEIPSGLFVNNAAVTNLEYLFYKTSVKHLQSGIFEGLAGAKTIGAVFQSCEQLTSIEEGVFDGLDAAKSFRYCFADCTALREIPEGLLRGLTKAYEFTYMFHNTALESVPAGLFKDARDYSSADFTYMFSECPNLKTVPAGLFDTFTKVTSPGYKYLFEYSGIETIPAGLFAKSTSCSSGFESVFENCANLKTIEGSIFPTSSSVSTLAYAFCNCTMLETIPADLFKPLAASTTKFTATFAGCSSLRELPAELFSANAKAKQFSETFADCTALESLPEGLLAGCSAITNAKGMFHGCTALTSLPADLFAACPAITSFEKTFAECSSLRELPAELFSAIGTKTSSITFASCFEACTALESIPASLFDTVRRINYINNCFSGCTSLTGESPYTVLTDAEGNERKVHLYERERGTDFPNAPVSASSHAGCFTGCEGLTDYANIPADWL